MKRGFTFAEIIIAIAILVLLSTVVLASIRSYVQHQALTGASASVAAVLADARTQTLSGNGGIRYGVHFESDSVTLFEGDTYSEGSVTNVVTTLDARVTISDITLADAGSDVVFQKLTGGTSDAGMVTIELISDASRQKTITIQGTGLISYD